MIDASIKEWFLSHRRLLPWREEPTPYRVWVSEVMLQQTQVAVVLPYFQRWMEAFPTIEALACAPVEHVLKIWEGLGYYSRARHLHEAAQFVMAHFDGALPSDSDQLSKIKGLGPYTQGAIRSFAFKQKAAAVDGNVLRVLSRLYAIEESIDTPSTRRKIMELAESLLPDEEPWLVVEGLIELGATVCKKVPECAQCPIREACLAYRHQKTTELPKRKQRAETTLLHRHVAVIEYGEKLLLQKGEKGKVMADLYEFPYIEAATPTEEERGVKTLFEKRLGLELEYHHPLSKQQHTFTRFRVYLYPHRLSAKKIDARFDWVERQKLLQLPFSSGHRRVLNEVLGL